MKPYVVMYNAVSVDGRITGFPVDMGLYYGQVPRWDENATLTGCDTLLDVPCEIPAETEADLAPPPPIAGDRRPLLVVPDSRGRFHNWHFLRQQPYWREFLALCTSKTPPGYLDYLDKRSIDYRIVGEDHVDYRMALNMLAEEFGVRVVRMDSGGVLNGLLLRAGLVDEINLLVHPVLVGKNSPKAFFHDGSHGSPEDNISLSLKSIEKLKDGMLLLAYDVVRPAGNG